MYDSFEPQNIKPDHRAVRLYRTEFVRLISIQRGTTADSFKPLKASVYLLTAIAPCCTV